MQSGGRERDAIESRAYMYIYLSSSGIAVSTFSLPPAIRFWTMQRGSMISPPVLLGLERDTFVQVLGE